MRHLYRHGPRSAHIVENNHRSGDSAHSVVNWRSGILNGGFKTIAADKDTIHSQSHCLILLDGHLHGVSSCFSRDSVDNFEDLGEGFTYSLLAAPTGHFLGHEIKVGDATGNVSTEHGVTNGVQCNDRSFLFYIQRLLDGHACDRVGECALKCITIEMSWQEIVSCSKFQGLFRDGFIRIVREDQDGDTGSGAKHSVECLDAITVRKGKCKQDGVIFVFAQAGKPIRKLTNVLYVKRTALFR